MRSIRTSLVIGTVIATVIVIVFAGVVLHRTVRSTMLQQFDSALENKIDDLASTVELEDGELELAFDDLDMGEFEPGETPGYVQVWLDNGSAIYRSPSLAANDLRREAASLDEPEVYPLRLPDGRRGRMAMFSFYPRVDDEDDDGDDGETAAKAEDAGESLTTPPDLPLVHLALARGTEVIDVFLARLRDLMIMLGGLMVLGAGAALILVIRRSLKPLGHLAGRISALDDGQLSSRIALPRAPSELIPVVDHLNGLLDRLERTLKREKSFNADLAHELRTPLAGLRSAIEVTISRPREPEEYRETLSESLEIIKRTQTMIHTMLYLARLDAGQVEIEERPVVVDELLQASWKLLEDSARARGLEVQWRLSPGVTVMTDPVLFEVAVRNVLENAVVHANEGGTVRIEVSSSTSPADVRVVNSGSMVAQEQVSRLLDRFVRLDSARDATRSHCGLGLAIVNRVAQILEVGLDIRSRVGGDFEVVLSVDGGLGR